MSLLFRAYGQRPRRINHRLRLLLALGLIFCGIRGASADPIRVLALGDSLTAGYGLPLADAFPTRLQAALAKAGIQATITNAGVSGDTTAGGLARLDWALANHPDYALVELGANDALRGIDPKTVRANLDAILSKLQAAHVQPLLIGMKAPRNWGPAYQAAFDRIYPDLAAAHHVPLYPFFLDGVALDPRLNQADMMHPNAAGVAVIVGRVLPAVEHLLGKPV